MNKLFYVGFFSRRTEALAPAPLMKETKQSALKIVHTGGMVELYFLAVQAFTVMDRYPSCLLARPDIFRRPWKSLVRGEEILTPVQNVVPRRTVRKLRRRTEKPCVNSLNPNHEHAVGNCSKVNHNGKASEKEVGNRNGDFEEKSGNVPRHEHIGRKGRPRDSGSTWQPTLMSISETSYDSPSNHC